MNQTYFEWYEFDVIAVLIQIVIATLVAMNESE